MSCIRRAARDFFGIIFVRLISKLSGIRYELALTLKNMIQSNWIVVELQARENEEKMLVPTQQIAADQEFDFRPEFLRKSPEYLQIFEEVRSEKFPKSSPASTSLTQKTR